MSETFVSSHYRGFTPEQIHQYLVLKFQDVRSSGENWVSKKCNWCHDDKGKADNQYKLAFTKDTGAYRCPRCGVSGSFWDLKKALGDIPEVQDWQGNKLKKNKTYKRPDQSLVGAFPSALEWFPDVVDYFAKRKINLETLKHYKVGAATYKFPHGETGQEVWKDHVCMTFPWIEYQQKGNTTLEVITRVKARAIDNKAFMRLDPAGGAWGLFGWHTIPNDTKEIWISEGELDCLSIWQETGMPTVSLPNGCKNLPLELLPYFERFEKITLWLDDDVTGQEAVESFTKKLGHHRCHTISTAQSDPKGPKDANEALTRGHSLKALLRTARPVPHEQILTWEDLKNDVFRELVNPNAVSGIPSDSLPAFNKILKGLRRGEMTTFTGPSGAGKTSILSQLGLDFAQRGVPTLWGSFEIKNHRLAKKMLKQYANKDLETHINEFQYWSERFSHLPMFFMKFFGATGIDAVLEAAKYCVYAHDVQHVILDNLQFMTSSAAQNKGYGGKFSKFDVQDEAVEKIRSFATSENVHCTLVIHPKKVGEGIAIDTSMLGGTAKAEQESDNVIVLQKGLNYRYLEIKKNRFDGDLGTIPYRYVKETNRIHELTPEELSAYDNGAARGSNEGNKSYGGWKNPKQNYGTKWSYGKGNRGYKDQHD